MAVTKGQGNPKWTRDEVILALDLYFDCDGHVPSATDPRVIELSEVLRAFPYHRTAAKQSSFRNGDGVAFKLQNLRQVHTGKGLGNVSRMDREVWNELGDNPPLTKHLAQLIRTGLGVIKDSGDEFKLEATFVEGRVVTETHLRRERSPALRSRLMIERRNNSALYCEICGHQPSATDSSVAEAFFEAHHILPLAVGGERKTKVSDLALLCACCHRMIHRAIVLKRRWLRIDEARPLILGELNAGLVDAG